MARPASKPLTDRAHPGVFASVLLHGGAVLLGWAVLSRPIAALHVDPAKRPGTALGQVSLTYYSPGKNDAAPGQASPRSKPAPKPVPSVAVPVPSPAAATPLPERASETGTGSSLESGLGDGDLQIALPTYSPRPMPSLASMPPGAGGDVVLDATIDEYGHIRDVKVLKSLGASIDTVVIATVQRWVYTPAKRDGKPVASGQELHFHYERVQAG